MAIKTYTRKDFQTIFPTFDDWHDKLLTKIIELYDGDTPAWMDDSKTFYSQKAIYRAMLMRFKKWFQIADDEDFLDQLSLVLSELFPILHAKTLHLGVEGIKDLNWDSIVSTMTKEYFEDPENNALEIRIEDVLAQHGLINNNATTTDATTNVGQVDNSNGGVSTVNGSYSSPVDSTGLGIDPNAQLRDKNVSIYKDDSIRRDSSDRTSVINGSSNSENNSTNNRVSKEIDKRKRVSTFADYVKAISDITKLNFSGMIYAFVNDAKVVRLFLEPTPDNVEGYQIYADTGGNYSPEEVDALLAFKADIAYVDVKNTSQDMQIATKANWVDVDAKNQSQDIAIAQKANSNSVYTKGEVDSQLSSKLDVSTADSKYSQVGHTHPLRDVEGLVATLNNKVEVGTVYTKTETDVKLSEKISSADLSNALDTHTQPISRVDGLQDALDAKAIGSQVYSKLESDLFNTVLGNGILESKDLATLGTKEWDAYEMNGSSDTYLLDLSSDINKAVLTKNALFNVWFAPTTNLTLTADVKVKIVEFNATLLSESTYDVYIDNGITHYRAKVSDLANCATEMLIWNIIRDGDTENRVVITINKTNIVKEATKVANKADKTYVDAQLATKANQNDFDDYKVAQSSRDIAQDTLINSKISGIKVVDANINNAEYTDIKEIVAGDNIRVTRTANGVKLDAQIDVQTYATGVWGIYNSQNINLSANTVTDIPVTYQSVTDSAILQTNANHYFLINNDGRAKLYDMDFQFNIPTGTQTVLQWQWFVNGENVGGIHSYTFQDPGIQQFQIPAIILNLTLETANTVALKMSTSRDSTIQYQNTIGIIDVIENTHDLSGGDMYTNVYDPDKDGKVTSAETADVALLANNSTQLGGLVGATAATANTVVLRDGSRRIKTNTPGSSEDAVNLSYLQGNYTTTTNMNTALDAKANSTDVYTKSATDGLLNNKANSSHTHFASHITDLSALLNAKAPLADPKFTGLVQLPALSSVEFDGITLLNLLSGYVQVSATQTIYGTKTFAVNPISTATQSTAINALTRKDYVDGQVATKANATHTHAISDVTNLQTTLDAKAASSHTHTIANITNLQTTLDAKAASSHTHTIANITNLQTTLDAKANIASPTFTGTVTIPTLTVNGVTSTNGLQVTGGNSLTMNNGWFYSKNASGTITTQFSPAGAFETQSIKVPSASTITLGSTTLQTTLDAKANDNEVVKISGNYTISGTKTFTGVINVPTPSTATQAANKAYVDSKAGTIYSVTDTTSGSTRQISFASIPEGKYEVWCQVEGGYLDDNCDSSYCTFYGTTGRLVTYGTSSVTCSSHSNTSLIGLYLPMYNSGGYNEGYTRGGRFITTMVKTYAGTHFDIQETSSNTHRMFRTTSTYFLDQTSIYDDSTSARITYYFKKII